VILQNFRLGNVNDKLIETMLMIDAAKRADAKKVTLLCPDLPYLDEQPGTPGFKADYFKLILNLFFKGVGLDELQLGMTVLNSKISPIFLQDKIFSREIAPFLINVGEHLAPSEEKGPAEEIAFFAGLHFQQNAGKIIERLRSSYGISGETVNLNRVINGQDSRIELGFSHAPKVDLKGKKVFIFQTCNTGRINDDLMETLLMIYAARKMGAKEIVLVMPYLPYNRQERKAKPREPISAKIVTNALVLAAGATHIITIDLHAAATQGFVDIPFQHITAFYRVAGQIKGAMRTKQLDRDPVQASPDVGRAKVARKLGRLLIGPNSQFAIVDKDRLKAGESNVAAIVGNVTGKDVTLFDDMIDSAGSIINAVDALVAAGAKRVFVAAVHGVLSDVTIRFKDKRGKVVPAAAEEYDRIRDFLLAHNKQIGDYLKVEKDKTGKPAAFTVNALIRLQAHPRISGIIITNSIAIPRQNVIDPRQTKVLSITHLLARVCERIIRGKPLENYEHEST